MSYKAITQKRLKEILRYDRRAGYFFWRIVTSDRVKVGYKAGSLHLGFNSPQAAHKAYRIAAKKHYGKFYSTGERK